MNNSDVANILKQDFERKEFIGVKTEIVLSSQGYVINDSKTCKSISNHILQGYVINDSKTCKSISNHILQDCVDNYDCLTDDKLEAIRSQVNNV